ncbi:MAG: hypothetical protein ACRED5_04270 [Propylenella sp.]
MTESEKAKIRMRADTANKLGLNLVSIGVFGPVVAALFGVTQVPSLLLIGGSAGFLIAGYLLYRASLRLLDDLDE